MNRRSALTMALALVARPAAAQPATIISLAQLRGTIKRHRGRGLVLHLWATWCEACLAELPLVAELARDARTRGIDVYSVSLDEPTARSTVAVARVLAQRGSPSMTRTILRMDDPDAVVAGIDPTWDGTIPAFFAYDREGKLRRAQVGEMSRDIFDAFVGDLAVKK